MLRQWPPIMTAVAPDSPFWKSFEGASCFFKSPESRSPFFLFHERPHPSRGMKWTLKAALWNQRWRCTKKRRKMVSFVDCYKTNFCEHAAAKFARINLAEERIMQRGKVDLPPWSKMHPRQKKIFHATVGLTNTKKKTNSFTISFSLCNRRPKTSGNLFLRAHADK